MKQEKIYVAMPYSAPYAEMVKENVNNAIRVALAILEKGHVPFVPHLTHLVELYAEG